VESDKEPNMSCFKNSNNKRSEPAANNARSESNAAKEGGMDSVPAARKNNMQAKKTESEGGMYVKVNLKVYKGYSELLKALENMFKLTIGVYSKRDGYKGSKYAPTYEDKNGDWMLVGDVPWEMFMVSCKRMRILKGSEAKGLGG
nr:auxin-responsive protein IAA4-like [Tanacetum cinerariifolium]